MKNAKTICTIACAACVVISLIIPSSLMGGTIFAADQDELSDRIRQEEEELIETNADLARARNKLEDLEDQLSNVEEELPRLELEIEKLETEIEYNRLQIRTIAQNQKLTELSKQEQEKFTAALVRSSYATWRQQHQRANFVSTGVEYNPLKVQYFQSRLISGQSKGLKDLQDNLESLASNLETFIAQTDQLEEKNAQLEKRKQEILDRRLALQAVENQVAGLKDRKQQIQQSLNGLREDQKRAAQKEADRMDEKPDAPPPTQDEDNGSEEDSSAPPPTNPGDSEQSGGNDEQDQQQDDNEDNDGSDDSPPDAEPEEPVPDPQPEPDPVPQPSKFIVNGRGRDLYQGHGVGMSQWGAHGMGRAGLSYMDILTTYYTNTAINSGYENRNINVGGYGSMNIEDYAAGIGEVPDRACGTEAQAADNPGKFVVDNPNSQWDCWPEETIKAQVVAARTYALFYVQTRGGSICTTAACQVYTGDKGKEWAAKETAGQVVTYSGSLIDALYSSDNSQGYGTANNDTIFQNIYGEGTPYPYLRAVNDSQWATPTYWTNWQCSTSAYEYSAINQMLQLAAQDGDYSSSTRSAVQSILNSTGDITGISTQVDSSQRVKKVVLIGENGNATLGGWWFKNFWNNWVYQANKVSNKCFGEWRYDYIYSQTFSFSEVV